MFAPGVVGTANATTAGWGNLGGGVTQMVMPLIFAGFVAIGYTSSEAWRISMVIPGLALLVMAFVYYFGTQDTPEGNIADLRAVDPQYKAKAGDAAGSFWQSCRDHRVWVLFLVYGACFGIEITIDNIAALYFIDNFNVGIKEAGIIAGLFGFMNLFARALGAVSGIVGAGGNVGAVLAGFLFKAENISYRESLFIIGIAVAVTAFISLLTLIPVYQSTTNVEPVLQPVLAGEPAVNRAKK
jgi:NNP family nitrate/nitrite transporter-like MFS transporter